MCFFERLAADSNLKTPEWKRFFAKNKKRLMKMDGEIHQLHEEAFAEIDCLDCGNCCRSLGPMIKEKDIDSMAKATRMTASAFIDTYLRMDEDSDWVFKTMPCPFLGADNYCAIYANRPKACREYPHTNRKKFYQIYGLTIRNTATCPIAFRVMTKLLDL